MRVPDDCKNLYQLHNSIVNIHESHTPFAQRILKPLQPLLNRIPT